MQRTLQELFVDRHRQTEAFGKMLEGQSRRRIMIISAGPGMGKSWLLRVFAQAANSRDVPLVQVDFADGQAYDALTLVRACRDAFGPEHFNDLTLAINDATSTRITLATDGNGAAPVNVNVSAGNISDSAAINIKEVGTIVKDNYFVVQTDNPIIRQVIEDRINSAFFECLTTLCSQQRVVFLFDTYERTSLETDEWVPGAADRWIIGQLLTRIRDGKLGNAIVVLAGRRLPEFGIEWNEALGRMTLEPLECSDITLYLRERRGLTAITDAEAARLCQAVAGNPQVLGLIGDNLEQANTPKVADDEW
jgi:hypothetical protein